MADDALTRPEDLMETGGRDITRIAAMRVILVRAKGGPLSSVRVCLVRQGGWYWGRHVC